MTKLAKRAVELAGLDDGPTWQEALAFLRLTRKEALEESLERFELAFERNEVVQDTLDAVRALIEEDK